MSNMSIQSKSKEKVKNLLMKKMTTLHLTTILIALETILKSQLEIINPVKDIALENKINKLIIVQVKKTNEFFEDDRR